MKLTLEQADFEALVLLCGATETLAQRYDGTDYDQLICAIKQVRDKITVPMRRAGFRLQQEKE